MHTSVFENFWGGWNMFLICTSYHICKSWCKNYVQHDSQWLFSCEIILQILYSKDCRNSVLNIFSYSRLSLLDACSLFLIVQDWLLCFISYFEVRSFYFWKQYNQLLSIHRVECRVHLQCQCYVRYNKEKESKETCSSKQISLWIFYNIV